jgi:Icc-related predicted phosphoesterase
MKKKNEIQFVHLTDIHGVDFLISEIREDLKKSDFIVITGDITHFGKEKEAAKVIDQILVYNKNILAVSGNCDFPEVEKYLKDNNFDLNRTIKNIRGITFYGLSGSLPCPGRTPFEYTEEKAGKWLAELAVKLEPTPIQIFATHQPPYNTINDKIGEEEHVGSREIRNFIENNAPALCLTGHIHEGIGIDTVNNCKIVNPGPFRTGKYAIITISPENEFVIDLKQISARKN